MYELKPLEARLAGGEAYDDDRITPAAEPVQPPKIMRIAHFRAVPLDTPRPKLSGAVDILRAARQCIVSGWSRRPLALDAGGFEVGALNDKAVRWSMHGAMMRASRAAIVSNGSAEDYAWRALISVVWDRYGCSIDHFNNHDTTTQGEVVRAFDDAIGLFRERLSKEP